MAARRSTSMPTVWCCRRTASIRMKAVAVRKFEASGGNSRRSIDGLDSRRDGRAEVVMFVSVWAVR